MLIKKLSTRNPIAIILETEEEQKAIRMVFGKISRDDIRNFLSSQFLSINQKDKMIDISWDFILNTYNYLEQNGPK